MPRPTISELLTRLPDLPFLADSQQAYSYEQIHQRCTLIASALCDRNVKRVACYMPDSIALISVMLGAAIGGKSLLVINRDSTPAQLEDLLTRFNVDLLVTDKNETLDNACYERVEAQDLWEHENQLETQELQPSDILVLTSGTTGEPKCARYEWRDLLSQVQHRAPTTAETWLLAYRLNHFAGIQMLMHVIVHGSQMVIPESSKVIHAIEALRRHSITHISSTPTFWRFALANLKESDGDLGLQHITLGSEAVSGDILNRLRDRFPNARIVHIYASTEAGSCVSVSDGKPGLPASVLNRDSDHATQFLIHDDELHVKTRHGMRGYVGLAQHHSIAGEGWLATGDLVKLENERILFLGRRSETINVGGTKVHPLEIEAVISALPQVKLVRVYGQENPVVGEIVAVDVIPQNNYSDRDVEESIREACTVFGRAMRPRLINVVSEIATNNQKVARGK